MTVSQMFTMKEFNTAEELRKVVAAQISDRTLSVLVIEEETGKPLDYEEFHAE